MDAEDITRFHLSQNIELLTSAFTRPQIALGRFKFCANGTIIIKAPPWQRRVMPVFKKMQENSKKVECSKHGLQQATFVCQHIIQTLVDQKPRGFWWADDPGNPWPDAWCSACEAKVKETGGEWTDESESFAGVTLLCNACYDKVKEINFPSKKNGGSFGNKIF